MALFTPPTTAEVREDLGLMEEQVNVTYSSEDLDADIAQKIAQQANLVEGRVRRASRPYSFPFTAEQLAIGLPDYSEAERTAWQDGKKLALALATEYFALAAMWRRSGQGNEVYTAKAAEYEALGEKILSGEPDDPQDGGLLGELTEIASLSGADTGGDGLSMLTITVGERYAGDEYSA